MFGVEASDVFPGVPIQTVSTGTRQLMVPVKNHAALRKVVLDIAAYNTLRAKSDFFSPHVFTMPGLTAEGNTFARHFGVPPDIAEDPFTGSATGGMGAYLYRYELIGKKKFVAEQGHWLGRPGIGFVEIVGSPGQIEAVKVGGAAVTVMRGEILI